MHLYHGQGTQINSESLAEHDIVFTTYETVCSDSERSNDLQTTPWYRVVLDEGTLYLSPTVIKYNTDLFFPRHSTSYTEPHQGIPSDYES